MGAPENSSKVKQIELQTPETGGVKPWHILALIGFSIAAYGVSFYPWQTFIGAALVGVVWSVTARYFRLEWEAKERAAIATSYACICGPQIISAIWPDESPAELEARANTFREKLRDSGNPYWQIIPIKIRYYQPVLSLPGHLSTAWDEYQYAAISAQHEENMRWLSSGCPEGLKVAFASQVMKANQNQNQTV
jgi:hypothetical protein